MTPHRKTPEFRVPLILVAVLSVLTRAPWCAPATARAAERGTPGIEYSAQRDAAKPWSIHVLKIDLRRGFRCYAALGKDRIFGLSQMSTLIKGAPGYLGRPVAGVNGDFYHIRRGPYQGDPIGLQIREGELVSDPSPGGPVFWLDKAGKPHIHAVASKMTATIGAAKPVAIGLNEARGASAVVLYTPRLGDSTRTAGGTELVLAPRRTEDRLPLRANRTYQMRVAGVAGSGNTKIPSFGCVLSLGPTSGAATPAKGATVTLSTALAPDLSGVRTAIAGGPMLLSGGKVIPKAGGPRHPRTAIGYNDKQLILAVVDGRQKKLSIGMRMDELAELMKRLGCTKAMNLDGGGSSTLWYAGKVRNSPSDGRERSLANALILCQPGRRR